ncbi:MAG TPA: hypothetical protein VFD58_31180 [Blastocatellia bacterium]|nr:hypothetical protein [Blastocatellia bacterium]
MKRLVRLIITGCLILCSIYSISCSASLAQSRHRTAPSPARQNGRAMLTRELVSLMIQEKEINGQCLREARGNLSGLFDLKATDLNGDGEPELILTGKGCACGGGKRCSVWIYEKIGTGYRRLFGPEMAEEIIPRKTTTNGYRDLGFILWAGDEPMPYKAVFDGKHYRVSEDSPRRTRGRR